MLLNFKNRLEIVCGAHRKRTADQKNKLFRKNNEEMCPTQRISIALTTLHD